MSVTRFRLGLVVNPFAGIGGAAALKGSDGAEIVSLAQSRGYSGRGEDRTVKALSLIAPYQRRIQLYTWSGVMGETAARRVGFDPEIVGCQISEVSTSADTQAAAKALVEQGVDLLLFSGGDGTARDIVTAVGDHFPVLGIPAGVKMHSGCYAISPRGAGEIIRLLLDGELVDIGPQEVRDLDEDEVREGRVTARYFGELQVPREGRFLQHTKDSGREVEALVLADIAADVVEHMEPETLYILGPGTTTRAVAEELGLENTLLGMDLILGGNLVGQDIDAHGLEAHLRRHWGLSENTPLQQPLAGKQAGKRPVKVILTATGGQGHLLGRGNQQLTPTILRAVGRDNLIVLATKTKLCNLHGRPLLLDSGDESLDREWSGYLPMLTGYRDSVMYPVEG
ncbi:MAG: ATP-NAD kinase family protein [Cellvibrionaceae bacterium]